MIIKGMVISAMFFGCRVSGEKNGIFEEEIETCFNLFLPFSGFGGLQSQQPAA